MSKLRTAGMSTAATQHNYRTQPVANADVERGSQNQELINHTRQDYWSLANARIEELQLSRLRRDAVRAVEVVLTGSSEAFK